MFLPTCSDYRSRGPASSRRDSSSRRSRLSSSRRHREKKPTARHDNRPTLLDEQNRDVTPRSLLSGKMRHAPKDRGGRAPRAPLDGSESSLGEEGFSDAGSVGGLSTGGFSTRSGGSEELAESSVDAGAAAPAPSDGSGAEIGGVSVEESAEAVPERPLSQWALEKPPRNEKELEENVVIEIEETDTITLLEVPSVLVRDGSEELEAIQARNERYRQLCHSRAQAADASASRHTQTLNAERKSKESQVRPVATRTAGAQAADWDIRDAMAENEEEKLFGLDGIGEDGGGRLVSAASSSSAGAVHGTGAAGVGHSVPEQSLEQQVEEAVRANLAAPSAQLDAENAVVIGPSATRGSGASPPREGAEHEHRSGGRQGRHPHGPPGRRQRRDSGTSGASGVSFSHRSGSEGGRRSRLEVSLLDTRRSRVGEESDAGEETDGEGPESARGGDRRPPRDGLDAASNSLSLGIGGSRGDEFSLGGESRRRPGSSSAAAATNAAGDQHKEQASEDAHSIGLDPMLIQQREEIMQSPALLRAARAVERVLQQSGYHTSHRLYRAAPGSEGLTELLEAFAEEMRVKRNTWVERGMRERGSGGDTTAAGAGRDEASDGAKVRESKDAATTGGARAMGAEDEEAPLYGEADEWGETAAEGERVQAGLSEKELSPAALLQRSDLSASSLIAAHAAAVAAAEADRAARELHQRVAGARSSSSSSSVDGATGVIDPGGSEEQKENESRESSRGGHGEAGSVSSAAQDAAGTERRIGWADTTDRRTGGGPQGKTPLSGAEGPPSERLVRLWSYSCDALRDQAVLCMEWSPASPDLLAVGYGPAGYTPRHSGALALWSMKNPDHPAALAETPSGVTSLAFSVAQPALLAAGLHSGAIALFNARRLLSREGSPAADLLSDTLSPDAHTEAVWQVQWVDKGGDRGERLVSIASDGRVNEWSTSKGLECKSIMMLRQGRGDDAGRQDHRAISRTASGLAFAFEPSQPNIYFAATEDGKLHVCSVSYSEQYLHTIHAHSGPVYRIQLSPLIPSAVLSCSADWTVRLWNSGTGNLLHTYVTDDACAAVTDAQWSPRLPTRFGSVTEDGRIHLWEVGQLTPILEHRETTLRVKPRGEEAGAAARPRGAAAAAAEAAAAAASTKFSKQVDKPVQPKAVAVGAPESPLERVREEEESEESDSFEASSMSSRSGPRKTQQAAEQLSHEHPAEAIETKTKQYTCLRFSSTAPVLVTGATDGSVDVYRITGGPSEPDTQEEAIELLTRAITGEEEAPEE